MSELKRHHINEVMDMHALTRGELGYSQVYYADDVDGVIAKLEKNLDLYKKGFKEDDRINAYLYAQLRHQKYRRCLAMAKWCDDAARLATWDTDFHRCRWYNKWMQHWLELAEKFKEAK